MKKKTYKTLSELKADLTPEVIEEARIQADKMLKDIEMREIKLEKSIAQYAK